MLVNKDIFIEKKNNNSKVYVSESFVLLIMNYLHDLFTFIYLISISLKQQKLASEKQM